MLDLFRKRGLTSVIYGAIMVATIFVFVIQFRPNATQKTGSLGETCAARVRGYCIDPKEQRANQLMITPRDPSGQLSESPAYQKLALDALIERELLIGEAERIGLTVTDDEVTTLITEGYIYFSPPVESTATTLNLPPEGRHSVGKAYVDPKTKTVTQTQIEKQSQRFTGLRPIDFHAWQAREILAAKVRALVTTPVRIGEGEAIAAYEREKSSATLSYAEFKARYFAKYAVDLTPAEVDAWAKDENNAKQVEAALTSRKATHDPQEKHLRHILAKFFEGREPREPTADERAKALGKISEAWARLKKGEAFADVAREMSEDGSAMQGGDLGDSTESFVPAFKVPADALKPGEVTSTVIESEFGYHIIERDDPAKTAEIDVALKNDAKRELATQAKATEVAKDTAGKVLSLMKSGKDGDAAISEVMAAVLAGRKPAAPPPIPPVTPLPSKGASGGDAGAGSKPAAGPDGGAPQAAPRAVFQTADKDKERPQFQSTNPFNRGGDPIASLPSDANTKVLQFAFEAKDGDAFPEVLQGQGAAIVARLSSHKTATAEEYKKERDVYLATILPAKQKETLSLFVKRLHEAARADIKIEQRATKVPEAGSVPAEDEAP